MGSQKRRTHLSDSTLTLSLTRTVIRSRDSRAIRVSIRSLKGVSRGSKLAGSGEWRWHRKFSRESELSTKMQCLNRTLSVEKRVARERTKEGQNRRKPYATGMLSVATLLDVYTYWLNANVC
ncbi:hypothetical protein QAD02_008707 [Eretmocerus hayati]|uniref:Uncharacterized protein n=1 Tax=Eretmocerus hayati TaxID=131215 RepID=A0ACC2N772_9HYME|nr:hypothetical protein QAD02_008707 [Eretmocerus hayati]